MAKCQTQAICRPVEQSGPREGRRVQMQPLQPLQGGWISQGDQSWNSARVCSLADDLGASQDERRTALQEKNSRKITCKQKNHTQFQDVVVLDGPMLDN